MLASVELWIQFYLRNYIFWTPSIISHNTPPQIGEISSNRIDLLFKLCSTFPNQHSMANEFRWKKPKLPQHHSMVALPTTTTPPTTMENTLSINNGICCYLSTGNQSSSTALTERSSKKSSIMYRVFQFLEVCMLLSLLKCTLMKESTGRAIIQLMIFVPTLSF